MEYSSTTYTAVHCNSNFSLPEDTPCDSMRVAFTKPTNSAIPVWGFREQPLPGVPGPLFVAETLPENCDSGSYPRPAPTTADSYKPKRREFSILSYDDNRNIHVPRRSEAWKRSIGWTGDVDQTRLGGTCQQLDDADSINPIYASRLCVDRRHDSMSRKIPSHYDHTSCSTKTYTDKSLTKTVMKNPRTIEHIFASRQIENDDLRGHGVKPAGMQDFDNSLTVFPCKGKYAASRALLKIDV